MPRKSFRKPSRRPVSRRRVNKEVAARKAALKAYQRVKNGR